MSLRTLSRATRLTRLFAPACNHSTRKVSTAPNGNNSGGIRVTTVFRVLLALGIGSTAYGLYDFYNALALWPPEVRADLRAGIKARNQEDLALSERYLRRAYQTALDLPISTFSPEPYLKLSGIAITLASVLEADGMPKEAWDIYIQALSLPRATNPSASDLPKNTGYGSLLPEEANLSPQETLRQVSIAHKLGEMAEIYGFGEEEEGKWLTWSVERLLRVVHDQQTVGVEGGGERQEETLLADLNLPGWVTKTNLGAPLEALGAFHARKGNVEYAMPLYLQAISLLIPPSSPQSASVEDKCRAAQIMNNLSSLIMSKPPSPETLKQAEAWARKSAAVCGQEINHSTKKKGEQLDVCESTLAVALFNIASLREMANDRDSARELFSSSLEQSKRIGMREGIMEAQVALRRIEKAASSSTKKT